MGEEGESKREMCKMIGEWSGVEEKMRKKRNIGEENACAFNLIVV